MPEGIAKSVSTMDENAAECAHAGPDEVCPVSPLQEFLSPIASLGLPLLMLALTWWLVARFLRQMKARRGGMAAATIIGGYLAMIAIMSASVPILIAAATNWGLFLISFALIWGVIVFVYSPAWLIALFFVATRARSA